MSVQELPCIAEFLRGTFFTDFHYPKFQVLLQDFYAFIIQRQYHFDQSANFLGESFSWIAVNLLKSQIFPIKTLLCSTSFIFNEKSRSESMHHALATCVVFSHYHKLIHWQGCIQCGFQIW